MLCRVTAACAQECIRKSETCLAKTKIILRKSKSSIKKFSAAMTALAFGSPWILVMTLHICKDKLFS